MTNCANCGIITTEDDKHFIEKVGHLCPVCYNKKTKNGKWI